MDLMGHEYIPDTENDLPLSFIGSRRWTSEQVADALEIASKFGPPMFFITMTCNPMWPEIQECLLLRIRVRYETVGTTDVV